MSAAAAGTVEHRRSIMSRISCRTAVAAGAVLAACLPIASAHAAGTTRTVVANFTEPYGFTVECSQLGPYAFEGIVSGEQRVRITAVTRRDGSLAQTAIHSSFTETDTNSVSQASLALAGTQNEIIDHDAGTRTVRGNIARGTQPGDGTFFNEAGVVVFDGGVGNVAFAAGRHDAVAFGGINAAVCAALAQA
jgi:hypothetical protein